MPAASAGAAANMIVAAVAIAVRWSRMVALLEFEVGTDVGDAVVQLDDELAILAGPALGGAPDVGVLVARGVILQAAGVRRFGDGAVFVVAGRKDLLGQRVARGEDVESLVAVQAELDRYGAAGLRHVVDDRAGLRHLAR